MAVKPFFSFSIDYGDGGTVLPQPRSATPSEKAARKARDIEAGAAGRAERAAKYAAQQAEKARQQLAAKQASEPPGPGHNNRRKGKPIIWDGDSECFEDLRYSPSAGGVFATFVKGGGQYFYPMSRAEAESWLVENGDVTGEIFNADIR